LRRALAFISVACLPALLVGCAASSPSPHATSHRPVAISAAPTTSSSTTTTVAKPQTTTTTCPAGQPGAQCPCGQHCAPPDPPPTTSPSGDVLQGELSQLQADQKTLAWDQGVLSLDQQNCQAQGPSSLACLAASVDQERVTIDQSVVAQDQSTIQALKSGQVPPI
jgi:hypothetical protein